MPPLGVPAHVDVIGRAGAVAMPKINDTHEWEI